MLPLRHLSQKLKIGSVIIFLLMGVAMFKHRDETVPKDGESPWPPATGAVISGYHVPPLPGWEGKISGQPDGQKQSVTYKTRVDNTKVQMRFQLLRQAGNQPNGLPELRSHVKEGLDVAQKSSPPAQVLEVTETTFRHRPAILTRTRTANRVGARERKILRVADGRGTFLLDQTLAGRKISPAAQREADRVWQVFYSGITMNGQ